MGGDDKVLEDLKIVLINKRRVDIKRRKGEIEGKSESKKEKERRGRGLNSGDLVMNGINIGMKLIRMFNNENNVKNGLNK